MKIQEFKAVVFKANLSRILLGYLAASFLFGIMVLLFSRDFFTSIIYFILAVCVTFIYLLFSKVLIFIKFFQQKKVVIQIKGFMFSKKKFDFDPKDLSFSYQEEVTGRGSKNFVFRLYDSNQNEIIKIYNALSGFSQREIEEIADECKKIDVKLR